MSGRVGARMRNWKRAAAIAVYACDLSDGEIVFFACRRVQLQLVVIVVVLSGRRHSIGRIRFSAHFDVLTAHDLRVGIARVCVQHQVGIAVVVVVVNDFYDWCDADLGRPRVHKVFSFVRVRLEMVYDEWESGFERGVVFQVCAICVVFGFVGQIVVFVTVCVEVIFVLERERKQTCKDRQ